MKIHLYKIGTILEIQQNIKLLRLNLIVIVLFFNVNAHSQIPAWHNAYGYGIYGDWEGRNDIQKINGHVHKAQFFCPHGKVHYCSICMPENIKSSSCESIGQAVFIVAIDLINCVIDDKNPTKNITCSSLQQQYDQKRESYGNCVNNADNGIKNGLVFGGSPEQQAALQRQQLNQNIGSFMGSLQNSFAQGSQQNVADFANKAADNQGKVDAINNQSDSNQPKDDKGIMGTARSNNQSTDNLGPGQETDADDQLSNTTPTGTDKNIISEKIGEEVNKLAERGIESLYDNQVGSSVFGETGKEIAGKINSLQGSFDLAKKFISGNATPNDLGKLFPNSNSIQAVSRDGIIGNTNAKMDALDQLQKNVGSDGTPEITASLLDKTQQSMNPGTYMPPSIISAKVDKIFTDLKNNNPFNNPAPDALKYGVAVGLTMGAAALTAPLWVPIAVGGWLVFSK